MKLAEFQSRNIQKIDVFVRIRRLQPRTGLCFSFLQHQNFEESQEAMKQQLLQLSILLKALDPELCDFLGK